MTELETGAWISAQGQHKSEKTLRRARAPYQDVDVFILQGLAENRRDLIHRIAFNVFDFEFRRNSVNAERHLSEFKRAQLQYVYGSVESSHLEEVET
jgi:hypothetical protein